MTALTEDLVKTNLRKDDFPVPRGFVAYKPEDLNDKTLADYDELYIKALIPMGRRGLAGAVVPVKKAQALDKFGELINQDVYGYKVERLLVEEKIYIDREMFISFSFDRNKRSVVLMVSSAGGVEIEKILSEKPDQMFTKVIDTNIGLMYHDAVELWSLAGLTGRTLLEAADITIRLYAHFIKYDLTLLEINPFCIDINGEIFLVGAMADVDEDAAFRQKEILKQVEDVLGNNRWAGLTDLERKVASANLTSPGTGTVRYREISDGNIALLTGGAGAGLVVVDSIIKYGGRPANYSDVGAGDVRDRIKVLFEAILSKPGIKGFLVAFSTLNLGRADLLAGLLKTALVENNIQPDKFPVVVRLAGLGEQDARDILSDVKGLHYHGSDLTLEEAAQKIVNIVNGRLE